MCVYVYVCMYTHIHGCKHSENNGMSSRLGARCRYTYSASAVCVVVDKLPYIIFAISEKDKEREREREREGEEKKRKEK
uniref:Bm156 n=1 Tax=Brugia malayi TaxID=6279 RepID=A0A1I9FZV7_BRUMA|nr:Bm156 [Brugia malayi]